VKALELAIAAAALAAAQPAAAAVRTTVVTWTGVHGGLTEWGGGLSNILSGIPAGDPANGPLSFSLTFTIKEPWPGAISDHSPFTCDWSPNACIYPGQLGSSSYGGSGAVTALLKVGDAVIKFGEGQIYQHKLEDHQLAYTMSAVGPVETQYNRSSTGSVLIGLYAGPVLSDGLTYDWRTMTNSVARTLLAVEDNRVGELYFNNYGGGAGAWGPLDPTSVEIRTAIPEPTTWTLLILGMGLAGVGLRSLRDGHASTSREGQ
jgi:hypothetical protein